MNAAMNRTCRASNTSVNPLTSAVQMMLLNVRAEREGDWSAHLMSSSNMLPFFFITNRTNYSRWMPVYILDMLELPAEIKSAFKKGDFSIR
jgi:hypothetical protein